MQDYHMIQLFQLQAFIWRKWKHELKKIYKCTMFTVASFTIAKMWEQPKYPSVDE